MTLTSLLPHTVCSAYRCPLCMHSVCDMQAYWEERDKEIAQTPMPTEYKDATVKVILFNESIICTVIVSKNVYSPFLHHLRHTRQHF